MEHAGNYFKAGIGPGREQPDNRSLVAYQLQVKLSASLEARVKQEQDYALNRFGAAAFSEVSPELVLARFEAREDIEETLLRWMQRIVGQQEAFSVIINNYGSMPGYPLYLRVQDPRPFREITNGLRAIDGLLRNNDCNGLQVYHHPRLVVTRKISKKQEMEILLEFSGRLFREELEIEELVLVKALPEHATATVVCRLMLSPKGLKRNEIN